MKRLFTAHTVQGLYGYKLSHVVAKIGNAGYSSLEDNGFPSVFALVPLRLDEIERRGDELFGCENEEFTAELENSVKNLTSHVGK